MLKRNAVIAVLTASTFLTAGVAYGANDKASNDQATQKPMSQSQASQSQASQSQASQSKPGQQQAERDFRKLSKDGSQAFMDLRLARLAIFDGKTDEAKKYIGEADKGFDKAKSDDSVFTEAEDNLKNGMAQQSGSTQANQENDQTKTHRSSSNASHTATSNTNSADKGMQTASSEPQQWLPVDGEIGLAEDFTATPTKKTALDEANKSLQKGDRQAALDKLKLADVDVDVAVAVVPLKSTIADVHQAKQMIGDGQYYQASQVLRRAEDGVRYDVAEMSGTPQTAGKMDNGKMDNAGQTSPSQTNTGQAKGDQPAGASHSKP